MPVSWTIDAHARLTTVTISGELTLELAQQTLLELYEQPSYCPPMADLWDLRTAQIASGPGEVRAFVRFIEARRGARGTDRTALVVASNHDFGLSRMYQSYAEAALPFAIHVFTRLEDAHDWLGCC